MIPALAQSPVVDPFLGLVPLAILIVALWRMWEPDRVPSFNLVLLALGIQIIYLGDLFINGAPPLATAMAVTGCAFLVFMLVKVIRAEQIQERIERHRRLQDDE